MKLIIFDIDGTLLDSVKVDDGCYRKTIEDLYGVDTEKYWDELKTATDGTDSNVTEAIFRRHFNRSPNERELFNIKKHFTRLLQKEYSKHPKKFSEIPGAAKLFMRLYENEEYAVGAATGSWDLSAKLKLYALGLDPANFPLSHSEITADRIDIVSDVIIQAKNKFHKTDFDRITYIGDGIWDLRTAEKLDIDFIAVDSTVDNSLKSAGARKVIKDFNDQEYFLNLINS